MLSPVVTGLRATLREMGKENATGKMCPLQNTLIIKQNNFTVLPGQSIHNVPGKTLGL